MPPDPATPAGETADADADGVRASRRVLPRACDVRPQLRVILGAVASERGE